MKEVLMKNVFVVLLCILLLPFVHAIDMDFYHEAKEQCNDRFDKEKCLAYFDQMLQDLQNPGNQVIERGIARKEARYLLLNEFPSALEERKIDVLKQKQLKAMEMRARQKLRQQKKLVQASLDWYNNMKGCEGVDTVECAIIKEQHKKQKQDYLFQVTESLRHALTVMLTYAQGSQFLSEKDAALIVSEANRNLAQAQIIRLFPETEMERLPELVANARALNTKISLLHAYGQLSFLLSTLSRQHLVWERKALHYQQDAPSVSASLEQFSAALDKATEELDGARNLLLQPTFRKEEVLGNLLNTHNALAMASRAQKFLYSFFAGKGLFLLPYDLIEEAIDDAHHGHLLSSAELEEPPLIIAKLYPEKGEALIILTDHPLEKMILPMLNEEELLYEIAKRTNNSVDFVKQQIRFELGGK